MSLLRPFTSRSRSLLQAVAAASLCLAASAQQPAPPASVTTPDGLAVSTPGTASAPGSAAPQAAKPQPRVARLSLLEGAVDLQRADNTAIEAPVINMPLPESARLLTGDYGQAEVEFEDGSLVRLTPRSTLAIDSLGISNGLAQTHLTLLNGLAYFELRKSAAATYQVEAGGTSFSPTENSTTRVAMTDLPATFAVLTGAVHVSRPDAFDAEVRTNETLREDFRDNTRYFLTQDVAQDGWDGWNASRDQLAVDQTERQTTARDSFAGHQGYGWADLDAAGSWYDVNGVGKIWQPNEAVLPGNAAPAEDPGADPGAAPGAAPVAADATVSDAGGTAGFDPYANGAWVWGSGAYTWASAYSWGWTPFRCGLWSFYPGFGWGWAPGSGCGRWGFGGGGLYPGGGFAPIGVRPPGYRPHPIPISGPGGQHPVHPIPGPVGSHGSLQRNGPVRILGATATPLRPVGNPGVVHGFSPVGQALSRDYPVDTRTHLPLVGVDPGATQVQPTYGILGRSTRVVPGMTAPARTVAPATRPTVTIPRPVQPGSVQPTYRPAAPVVPRPAPPPAAIRPAPAPAPAAVHAAPK